jgi:hypothetical protein
MTDELATDQAAPEGAAVVPDTRSEAELETPPEPTPEPAPETPEATAEPELLPSEKEGEAAAELRETVEKAEALEAAANVHADSTAASTVGLLHDDTYIQRAPDISGAGPRWEQVHTSLTAE